MKLFRRRKKDIKEGSTDIRLLGGQLYFGGAEPLENSALWMCVTSLARQYATLPLKAYRKTKDFREPMGEDTYLAKLMAHPNPLMDAYRFRFIMGFNFEMHGQAVAIMKKVRGIPVTLWPVCPAQMLASLDDRGQLWYTHVMTGNRYPASDMLIINNTPSEYASVLSPIQFCQSDLDLEKKSKKMQLEYYDGLSTMGRVIKVPANTTKEAMDQVQARFDSASGFKNFVVKEGITVDPIHVQAGEISKITEAQKWSSREVAKRFGVPPFLAGDTDTTYGNAEQQGLQMVIYCLQPRVRAWEMALNDALCAPHQFFEFSLQGLLRGDHAARSSFYHNAILDGWMCINDIRKLENLPPIENGDVHFFPTNYGTLDNIIAGVYAGGGAGSPWDLPTESEKKDEEKSLTEEERKKRKHLQEEAYILEAKLPAKTSRRSLERLIRKQLKAEIAELKRLIASGLPTTNVLNDWNAWIRQNASEMEPQYVALYTGVIQRMLPPVQKQTGIDDDVPQERIDAYADKYSKDLMLRHTAYVYNRAKPLVGTEDFEDGMANLQSDYPAIESEEEVNRSSNAFAVFLYSALGVTVMHSVAQADACSFCKVLDGKVCSVNGYILQKGSDEKDADGNVRHIQKNYRHPPYHGHCSCFMAPGE